MEAGKKLFILGFFREYFLRYTSYTMAEKFELVEAICGTVLVKKIERQKALKFPMQNSFKKRMLFIYREQSEKSFALCVC